MEDLKRKIGDMDDRLREIEQREVRIVTLLDSLTEKLEVGINSISSEQSKMQALLMGDGQDKPGLLVRIDRIEQWRAGVKWFLRAAATAIITLVAGSLYALLN